MTPFAFRTAGEIRFGRGVAAETAGLVAPWAERFLLVHGASAARADWLADALAAEGRVVTRLAVPREPDLPLLAAAVETARQAGCGAVVALGGGSVMDTGKAVAALVPSRLPAIDHLEVVGAGRPLDEAPLPVAALPTTAGTGAEVTRNAVIGVPEAARKVSLRDPRMLPRLALVDPALTDGAPRGVTLAAGLDAITQVIEPYVSVRANPLTDALCRSAIPRGLAALVRLTAGEDREARDEMAWTGLCGGLALANAGLGAVHGLAGPIGGVCGAAHGAVCGALLPHVLRANTAAAEGETARRLDEVFGWIAAALPPECGLDEWSRQHGLQGLAGQGLPPAAHPSVAEAAEGSSSMAGNPVALDRDALLAILQAAN